MSFGYQVLGFGAFPTRGPGAYVPTHAAVFDGTADYLRYRPNAVAKDRTRYTISFWMKRNHPYDTAAVLICNNKNTSGNDYEQLKLNNDDLEYQFAVSGSGKGDRKTYNLFRDPTGWVHIMFVRDVTTTKIYVNGSEANYAATTDPGATDLGYFTSSEYFVEIGRGNFGGGSTGNYYNGMFAEFIVLDGVAATIGSFGETSTTGEWVPKNPLAGYGTDTQEKNISDWGDLNSVYFNFSDSLNLGKNFRPLDVTVNDGSYKIDKSIFFDGSDDYLLLNPTTPSTANKYTISMWLKPSEMSVDSNAFQTFFSANVDASGTPADNAEHFGFDSDGKLVHIHGNLTSGTRGVSGFKTSAAAFNDPTAWGHFVCHRNGSTTQYWWNGVELSMTQTTAFDSSSVINSSSGYDIVIGSYGSGESSFHVTTARFDGYLADVILLDGTAVTDATNFGGWDASGIWMPKDPTAQSFTFGNNGFLLQFEGDGGSFDSNADAGGVGADTSGQNNHFTGNGNVHNNRTTMSPTDTSGDNEGNFITWNSIANGGDVTLSEGNFVMTAPNPNANNFVYATHAMRTGKWYAEFGLIRNSDFNDSGIYLVEQTFDFGSDGPHTTSSNNQWGITLESNTQLDLRHNNARSAGGSITIPTFDYANDRLLMAFDADNKKVHFGYYDASASNSKWLENDGTVETTDNPPTASPSFASTGVTSGDELTGDGWYLVGHLNDNGDTANKMRIYSIPSTWSGTAPSGYKAISTFNYASLTYTDARKYFAPVLYTGTGSSRYVRGCYDSSGTAWTPDWAWIKGRTDASDHAFFDCVRDFGTRALRSSNSTAQDTDSTAGQGFISGGIELGDSSGGSNAVNRFQAAGYTYVAWFWKAGGAPLVDNDNTSGAMDDGSVFKGGSVQTSYTPSGSPSKYPKKMSIAEHGGFSIVEYVGTGSALTYPHGLDRTPDMIINKCHSDASTNWVVFHSGINYATNTSSAITAKEGYLSLNSSSGAVDDATQWNDTDPTAHLVSLGSGGAINGSANEMISYCFAKTPGLIGIGSYVGTSDANGPFVVVDDGASGFRPAWLMTKRVGGTENWFMKDAARGPVNTNDTNLLADSANAEASGSGIDFLANGFKVRVTSNSVNANGENIVYLAFSDQAFSLQARAR